MSHEVAKGRLYVRMLLTTPLQRAMPGRSASFPLATAGNHRDVLETHGTTGYSTKPKLPEHPPLPATTQPRAAKTPNLTEPCPQAKRQMLLVLTIRHVPTTVVTSLV